jgi:hypothetical protein
MKTDLCNTQLMTATRPPLYYCRQDRVIGIARPVLLWRHAESDRNHARPRILSPSFSSDQFSPSLSTKAMNKRDVERVA